MSDVQELVEEWKNRSGNGSRQLFCCVPYRCQDMTMEDCKKRRGIKKTHYAPLYFDDSVHNVPKPQFVNCVSCNVWQQLPPQEIEEPSPWRNRGNCRGGNGSTR